MSGELTPEVLRDAIATALDDGKGEDIRVLDVRAMTSITDYMIVVSGRSSRQVRSLKDRVIEAAREHGVRPLGVEGENPGEWVLVDFGDVIVHAMQQETRDFYQLEKLWDNQVIEAPLVEQANER
ncbi:MAG: ribosome silencing factor [Proteobacteria bacterium]|nr:ribosome silencing factor [Pseudomonadota bacterium]